MKFRLLVSFLLLGSLVFAAQAREQRPILKTGDSASHGNLVFDDMARLEEVKIYPPNPSPTEPITITARFKRLEQSSLLPLKTVTARYRPAKGGPWQTLPMTVSTYDQDFYYAHLDPQKADFEVTIRAEDVWGNSLQEVPAYSGKWPEDNTAGEWALGADPDDADTEVEKDLDTLETFVTHTKDALLVTNRVQGLVNKGRIVPTKLNLYACFLVNRDQTQGLADVMNIPAFIYAPLLNAVLPFKSGLYKFSAIGDIKELGNARMDHPDFAFKAVGNRLHIKTPLSLLGANPGGLIQVGCFASSVDSLKKPNPMPRDMGAFVSIYRRSHKVKVAPLKAVAFKAGAATVDITPKIGTPLGGYTHRAGKPSQGVDMPLKAFAISLEAGGRKHVFASVDIVLFTHSMFQKVAKIVEANTGLRRYQLSIAATHTHHGSGAFTPMSAIITGTYQPKVEQELVEKVAQAIIQAEKNLQPAKFGYGRTVVDMANNRVVDKGPEDHELGVLRFDDMKGKPIAVMFNYAAHPTTWDNLFNFHPDFPGIARTHIEKKWPGVHAIFINGAQGDQSSSGFGGDSVGDAMGKQVVALAAGIKTQPTLKMSSVWSTFIFSEIRNYESIMQAVKLNDLLIQTVPGELFSEVGQRIKAFGRNQNSKQVALFGLTSDTVGYIVPKTQYRQRPYEALFCLFGEDEADFVEARAQDLMSLLKNP